MVNRWRDEVLFFWYGMFLGFVIGVISAGVLVTGSSHAQGVPGVLENGQGTYQWAQPDGTYSQQNPLAVPRHNEPSYGRKPCP